MYRLVPDRKDTFERVEAESQQLEGKVTLAMQSPWAGIMPDIAPHNQPANSCDVATRGLIARPDPTGFGEVLMPDDGTIPAEDSGGLQANPLPLGSNNGLEVVGIAELSRTNASGTHTGQFELTLTAVVAGDNSTAASRTMHRIKPDTSPRGWEVIPFDTHGDTITGPLQNREAIPDFAVMAEGAPGRSAYQGAIDQPVLVWCNTGDSVQVYPCADVGDAGQHKHSRLTDEFTIFEAKTVEAYRGRLFYGNTLESGVSHRQRIRWTAPFTADPKVANPGSGAMDLREFSRDLLRLEKIGDGVAAYFEDGTAFLRTTGNPTAPMERQILKERRGLLSTHAMVPVGDNAHFGIFDDGWFLLDSSGRWREVGMQQIGEGIYPKWKRYFYDNLDINNRHRLFCAYDGNFIRICYPRATDPSTDIAEVWVYDLEGDRVFITDRSALCMSSVNQQISDAVAWEDVTGKWSEALGSWDASRARFGLRSTAIGTSDGWVLLYDPDLFTEFNTTTGLSVNSTFNFRTPLSDLGQPRFIKTAHRLWLEYINTNSTNIATEVFGNTLTGSESGTIDVSLPDRIPGEVIDGWRHTDFSDTHLGFQMSGTAPVLIRSMEVDLFQRPWERRE